LNIYNIPPNTQEITELYAVLSVDENGEGILSATTAIGSMPFVFGYEKMIDKVMPLVNQIAKETGKKLRIVKFTNKEIIKEIK
jgi:hypothetical protein